MCYILGLNLSICRKNLDKLLLFSPAELANQLLLIVLFDQLNPGLTRKHNISLKYNFCWAKQYLLKTRFIQGLFCSLIDFNFSWTHKITYVVLLKNKPNYWITAKSPKRYQMQTNRTVILIYMIYLVVKQR